MRTGTSLHLTMTVTVLLAAPPLRVARAEPCVPIPGACDADSTLADQPDLATILAVAQDRNPELREARARAAAADARVGIAGGLPDLELKGELWGVPLAHPLSFDMANTIMVGLRQSFPAWGSLDARGRAAHADALAALDAVRARQQEIAAQARRAFAAYYLADHEARMHLEHAGLTSRLLEVTRAQYALGRGTQQDTLRLQAELSRLHAEITGVEQRRSTARALLNALMDRPSDAPLGPAPDINFAQAISGKDDEAMAAGARSVDERRPELSAAARAVSRSEAVLDASKREANLPAVMVGADYWYMPTLEMRHGYGAMLTVSLPWLNPRHREEIKAAEHLLAAERSSLAAQRASARYQLDEAAAKLRAARATLTILHGRVLPDARRAYEAAEAQLQAGHGDVTVLLEAARAYLAARIDEVRAIAELEASRADYARAAGEPR
jgi:outer membrane protein TolC